MGTNKTNLKDSTIMWFGKHKGLKLKDIPDSYFKYLLNNNISFRGIKHYTKVFRNIKIKNYGKDI